MKISISFNANVNSKFKQTTSNRSRSFKLKEFEGMKAELSNFINEYKDKPNFGYIIISDHKEQKSPTMIEVEKFFNQLVNNNNTSPKSNNKAAAHADATTAASKEFSRNPNDASTITNTNNKDPDRLTNERHSNIQPNELDNNPNNNQLPTHNEDDYLPPSSTLLLDFLSHPATQAVGAVVILAGVTTALIGFGVVSGGTGYAALLVTLGGMLHTSTATASVAVGSVGASVAVVTTGALLYGFFGHKAEPSNGAGTNMTTENDRSPIFAQI